MGVLKAKVNGVWEDISGAATAVTNETLTARVAALEARFTEIDALRDQLAAALEDKT